jgi:hypothetical protein
MLFHQCFAYLSGTALSRVVWLSVRERGRWVVKPVEFVLHDKREFSIDRTEWRPDSMYLIDDSETTLLGQIHGFSKAIDRLNYIISRWRNTPETLGWGHGTGDRLYRVAKWRKPLIHLFLQTLEAHAGGIRVASVNADFGTNDTQQESLLARAKQEFENAISLDTIAMPAGIDLKVIFPPGESMNAIVNAINGYLDPMISKIINGAPLMEQTGDVGSYALGKVHAAQQHIRMKAQAKMLASEVQTDYIERVLQYNPWIYSVAGVPANTPSPRLVLHVAGGHDQQKAAGVVKTLTDSGIDLLKDEVYDLLGFSMPTQAQIAAGEVIEGKAPQATPPGLDPFGGFGLRARRRIPWAPGGDSAVWDRIDARTRQRSEEAAPKLSEESHARTVEDFGDDGFSGEDAEKWISAGVFDPMQANEWSERGFSPEEAGVLVAQGVSPTAAENIRAKAS